MESDSVTFVARSDEAFKEEVSPVPRVSRRLAYADPKARRLLATLTLRRLRASVLDAGEPLHFSLSYITV